MANVDRDYYEILNVHPSAHPDVIQAAYRRLTLLYHPDRNSSPEATQLMTELNRAYEVLIDADKRAAYDRSRGTQPEREIAMVGVSGWELVDRIDELTHTRNVSIFSFDSGDSGISWGIHCVNSRLSLTVTWNTLISYSDDVQVQYRIGNQPVETGLWFVDSDTMVLPNDRVLATIDELLNADEFVIRVFPDVETPMTAVFQTHGLSEAIKPVIEAYEQQRRENANTDIGDWEIIKDEIDALTRTRTVIILLGDSVGDGISLVIRCENSQLDLFVTWGTFINYSVDDLKVAVDYKVGNHRVERLRWGLSSSYDATFLPDERVSSTINELLNVDEFVVRVFPDEEIPITAVFYTHGLSEAIKPVLEAYGQQ